MANKLDDFVESLASIAPGSDAANPYRDPLLCRNLRSYLGLLAERPGPRILLVGEALGYRGGSHTGIPFSSTRLLREAPHRFLQQLKPKLHLTGNDSEATAAALWQFLAGRQRIPLCWNAFPFHPHRAGTLASNRSPRATELRLGLEILGQLIGIYKPDSLIAVGNAADRAVTAVAANLPSTKVRHPSYGGKPAFMAGMGAAYQRRLPSCRVAQGQNETSCD